MRSFQHVDDKLFEAEFFLQELKGSSRNLGRARHFFSAFVAAARSVTFSMQACLKGLDGFSAWYETQQTKLRANDLARFFHACRTDSQHIGLNPIMGGAGYNGEALLFFGQPEMGRYEWLPETDVVSACEAYMALICKVVSDCYSEFGESIDPDRYYSMEVLKANGLTIEDVEEELGFPRGYTKLPDSPFTEDDRLAALKRHIPMSGIKPLLEKYASL